MISTIQSTTNGHFRRRLGLIFTLIGFFIFILGAVPGLFGLDRSPIIGFVQIAVFLVGLGIICLGGYVLINSLWNGTQKTIKADIVGPICESGDFLAKEREVESLATGELVAVMSAGAYGFSMSSNYNSRPRVAEVMVSGTVYHVVRARETYEDLIRGEAIPAFLSEI